MRRLLFILIILGVLVWLGVLTPTSIGNAIASVGKAIVAIVQAVVHAV